MFTTRVLPIYFYLVQSRACGFDFQSLLQLSCQKLCRNQFSTEFNKFHKRFAISSESKFSCTNWVTKHDEIWVLWLMVLHNFNLQYYFMYHTNEKNILSCTANAKIQKKNSN